MSRSPLLVLVLFSATAAFARSTPTATLTVSDEATNPSGIGRSVAISGSVVAAGAPATTVNGHFQQGAVDVFTKAASAPWTNMTESARLIVASGNTSDELGWAVAISGDGNVIAATGSSGLCWIFLRPAGGWTGTISAAGVLTTSPPPRTWIVSGPPSETALAMNATGTVIVQGFPNTSYKAHFSSQQYVPSVTDVGSAYIWVQPSTGWAHISGINQTATLSDPDGVAYDSFGTAVGVAANTVVVGAPVSMHALGKAYLFQKPPTGWLPLASKPSAVFTASDGAAQDRLGTYLTVGDSGSLVALSQGFPCSSRGTVYVYAKSSNKGWPAAMTQSADLTPSDFAGTCFGQSRAVVTDLVIVGAPLVGTTDAGYGPGADYSFAKPATGWADMSLPISMVADGSTLLGYANSIGGRSIAVGAAGAVYIFSH